MAVATIPRMKRKPKQNPKLKDVLGDGSCFYRSIIGYCNDHNINVSELFPGTRNIRRYMSKYAREDKKQIILKTWNNLKDIPHESLELVLDYQPEWFQVMCKNKNIVSNYLKFKNRIARDILKTENFAGELDVAMMREILKDKGYTLEIHNDLSNKKLKQLKYSPNKIVLVNVMNIHYMYINFSDNK